MDSIKSKYLKQLYADFELLSEIILKEMSIIKKMFGNEKDPDLCEEISRYEKIIDNMDLKIREEVINGILLFDPKAMDLRKIMSYHDMTIYMERIGDLNYNISNFVKSSDLTSDVFLEFEDLLIKMINQSTEMVSNALYAFLFEDKERAYLAINADNNVDDLFREINKKLRSFFIGKILDETDLKMIMNINSISYNIERIGDNATNIAESAVYLVEGKDIRHGNK